LTIKISRADNGFPTKYIYNVLDKEWDIAKLSVRNVKVIFDAETKIPLYVTDSDAEPEPETMAEKLFRPFMR